MWDLSTCLDQMVDLYNLAIIVFPIVFSHCFAPRLSPFAKRAYDCCLMLLYLFKLLNSLLFSSIYFPIVITAKN